MLAVMTFNGYIGIALVIGASFGYWIFGMTLIQLNLAQFNQSRMKDRRCDAECAGTSTFIYFLYSSICITKKIKKYVFRRRWQDGAEAIGCFVSRGTISSRGRIGHWSKIGSRNSRSYWRVKNKLRIFSQNFPQGSNGRGATLNALATVRENKFFKN